MGQKFKCYEIHRPNIPDNGCTEQCKECMTKQFNLGHSSHNMGTPQEMIDEEREFKSTAPIMYTEEEVELLATNVAGGLVKYALGCVMTRNENPQSEAEFNRLFNKYKKKS